MSERVAGECMNFARCGGMESNPGSIWCEACWRKCTTSDRQNPRQERAERAKVMAIRRAATRRRARGVGKFSG